MRIALCAACIHVAVVAVAGLASGRHHQAVQQPRPDFLQHQHPDSLQDPRSSSAKNIHALASPEAQPLAPRHPDVRGQDFFRMSSVSRHKSEASVHVCDICPDSEVIAPCKCQCLNETAAQLVCGPELLTCSQLTEVMCLTAYPVNPYHRLVVQNTELACKLEMELWGPLMFKEIHITNNRFQALDNRAFQPFSATLMDLDLEGNSLQDVYFSTMSDTPLLRRLSLRNNKIDFLPGYSAMELALLEWFDASFNEIPAIHPQTFAGMPKVQMINLSNNAISKVSAGAFTIAQHAATSLYINLAHNLITSIEPGMLEGVRVCSIDLQDNRLTILSEKVFRPIIDFTAASAVFWTSDNPLDCDAQFCWIATNETVSSAFGTVLCPNLGNEPVEVLKPTCSSFASTTPATRRIRNVPRVLPARLPSLPFSRRRKQRLAPRKQRLAPTKLRNSPHSLS